MPIPYSFTLAAYPLFHFILFYFISFYSPSLFLFCSWGRPWCRRQPQVYWPPPSRCTPKYVHVCTYVGIYTYVYVNVYVYVYIRFFWQWGEAVMEVSAMDLLTYTLAAYPLYVAQEFPVWWVYVRVQQRVQQRVSFALAKCVRDIGVIEFVTYVRDIGVTEFVTYTRCNTARIICLGEIWPQISTHYNALQHTAAHCFTLQRTATYCNTLQRTVARTATHTATCTATCTATHGNTLRNTPQHTATHCNIPRHPCWCLSQLRSHTNIKSCHK